YTEQDGVAIVRLPAGNSSLAVATRHQHDLRGAEGRIEVLEPPSAANSLASLSIALENNKEWLEIRARSMPMHPNKLVVMKTGGVAAEIEFVPEQHRWWRIRESGGEVFAEASPDSQRWTLLTTL